jgi:GT2 family glycosyltransferase
VTGDVAISVIMSTHNRAHYLPDALKALSEQDCDVPFEVIVIDNASTDDTAQVLDTFCRSDPRFRHALEPRLGLSCGKNAGIGLARAPLLLFTDDDMLADAGWIRAYRDFFAGRGEDELTIAGGPYVPIPDDLGPWPEWFGKPALADMALLDYHECRPLKMLEYVWGGNMAIPARLFERLGLWDESVGRRGDHRGTFEDTEFQDRIHRAGGSVWFCPTAVVNHRVPRNTITPRQIATTAFARGRNHLWFQTIPVWREPGLVPKRNAAKGLLRLVTALCAWMAWAVGFRLFHTRALFERTREAAFSTGYSLDTLRAGRDSPRMILTLNRLAFAVRNVILRVLPR